MGLIVFAPAAQTRIFLSNVGTTDVYISPLSLSLFSSHNYLPPPWHFHATIKLLHELKVF